MVYRGSGFLDVVFFGSSPTPYPPHPSVITLSLSSYVLLVELTDGEGGGGGRGAKSYDGEKAWSSTKHSILSGVNSCYSNSVSDTVKLSTINSRCIITNLP
jgi:hypothetical protein